MNKKRFLWPWAIVSLSLASCSSSSTGAVGIFIYDKTDTFMSSLSDALMSQLDKAGLSYDSVYDGERSQTAQNQDFISFLDEPSSKATVVNTVDRLASSALIEKAETKDKPIVFINREPLKEDLTMDEWSQKNCYYVGADSEYEGTLQARIADQFFGGPSAFTGSSYDKNNDGKVQVLVFKGELGHQDAEARTKNSLAGLTDDGYSIEILNTLYCNWERQTAYDTMKTVYDDSIELLFSNNDDMALGAIDYLLEKDNNDTSATVSKSFSERYFPIVGVDATKAGKEAVESGYLTGTVLNDAEKQSNVIVGVLDKLINNKDIPSFGEDVVSSNNMYYVRGSIVTKS